MSCLHIPGTRRVATSGCPPLRFTSPSFSKSRELGLRRKATDSNENVRAAAASDPNLPLDLQWTLWDDQFIVVRGWLARNPSAHPDVLRSLARDGSPVVRGHAAWNARTPIEEIKYLAKYDDDPAVRAIAQTRLDNESAKG